MDAETIVVGAGSAGTVIATRMSERSDRQVLLIEAGPDYPAAAGYLPPGASPCDGTLPPDLLDGTRNSMQAHDWGYRHRPTPGQVLFRFPRGKVVGGSSAVNTCIALRGQPYDFDEWAARGLAQWSFDACLPAFKRLERDLDIHNDWHGEDGPIPIRRHPAEEIVPWQAAFLEACSTLGFPACADHNDPRPEGHGPHPMNKIRGERMSAARCYLTAEVRRRENLRIRPHTLVRRILSRNREVTGVEVETSGRVDVLATRRVVLCAGAIATPCILLRSGIGPRNRVERLGVDCIADVPAVGARLLDHPGAAIILVPRPGVARVSDPLLQTVLRYTSEGSAYPNDMQLQPGSFFAFPAMPLPLVSIMCSVGKPKGWGSLTLSSADPHEKPQIESSVLVHPEDRARAVEAMELAWFCVRSKPMKQMAYFLWPSEKVLRSRASISEWIGRSCDSGYHPCGTVPMGDEKDPDAAVDGYGRVRGMTGLWVADASIMPTIPSANINLPALMIGERFGQWFRDGVL